MREYRGLRQRVSVSEETSRTSSPAETEKAQGNDRTDGGKTQQRSQFRRKIERNREG